MSFFGRVLMKWNEYDKIVSVWKQLENDKVRPFLWTNWKINTINDWVHLNINRINFSRTHDID